MKNSIKLFSALAISTAMMACNSNKETESDMDSMSSEDATYTSTSAAVVPGEYTDLNSGQTVYIVVDPETGWAVDSITRAPVEFYIDRSGDTLHQTGAVVNYAIMQSDGKWILDETKIKRDGDELKIKYADGSKLKIDGDEMKMKDENGKIKIDGDTMKVKPD